MRSWEEFDEFEKKGAQLLMTISPYLAPLDPQDLDKITLVDGAPLEIINMRDEFLKWSKESQTRERVLQLSDYY